MTSAEMMDRRATTLSSVSVDHQFRILFVCSANLCRSVMAERLTRRAFVGQGAAGFRVSSAGITAATGQPPHPYTVATLADLGIDTVGFVARNLTRTILRDSDLVLTATAHHRDCVVAIEPAASSRTFTMREFARLTAQVAVMPPRGLDRLQRAHWVVKASAALRGQVPYIAPPGDDIADPKPRAASFRACRHTIAEAVRACVSAFDRPESR